MATCSEGICPSCERACEAYRRKSSSPELQYLHTDAALINSKRDKAKKVLRKDVQADLREKVAILRNSLGGTLLIHLSGQHEEDRYPGGFYELVDDDLHALSGEDVYTDVYNVRHVVWLNDITGQKQHRDFLVLTVEPSTTICISKPHSKQSLGFSLKDLSVSNIISIINDDNYQPSNVSAVETGTAASDSVDVFYQRNSNDSDATLDFQKLHEFHNVEFKSFTKADVNWASLDTVVDWVWRKLRLAEYISAFTKIKPLKDVHHGGGFVFLGIREDTRKYPYYTSTVTFVEGFPLDGKCCREFGKRITKTAVNHMKACDIRGENIEDIDRFLQARVHEVNGPKSNRSVLEIRVKFVPGIVFSSHEGPNAPYKKNGNVAQFTVKEIVDNFRKKN